MNVQKLMIVAVVMALVVGLAGTAVWAGCGSCGPKHKHETVAGTVKSIDASASKLVLSVVCCPKSKQCKDVSVALAKEAKITLDGKEATLADLKADDTVKATIETTQKCGTKVASLLVASR